MDVNEFRVRGKEMVDYICGYLDTLESRRVTPSVEPGYLRELLPTEAPHDPEDWDAIMADVESKIMPGVTHWQHPRFHAYFPSGNSFPSILGDMLGDAIGCIGFSWAASPACTELETIVLDWLGKAIGLPDEFLAFAQGSKGGGVIQFTIIQAFNAIEFEFEHPPHSPDFASSDFHLFGLLETHFGGKRFADDEEVETEVTEKTVKKFYAAGFDALTSASECVLVTMLAARAQAIRKQKQQHPFVEEGVLLSKLMAYCSKEAHSCVEKAAMICFVKLRILEPDEKCSLRGATIQQAMEEDEALGLIPFFVSTTLGTTSCCSFDNLREVGPVCRRFGVWLHVDGAYAGNAFICPELKPLLSGIEYADSFNTNPNKWLLVNFDCSTLWVRDKIRLTSALVVDPLYLQHGYSHAAIDYRHWGVPLSRRFRSLKLWFVIRNYGISGLQKYIRHHIRLAKRFETLVRKDKRFEVCNEVKGPCDELITRPRSPIVCKMIMKLKIRGHGPKRAVERLGLVCFRLKGTDELNQKLLSNINASGKIHMVPASVNEKYVIRFCAVVQNATEEQIDYAWDVITEFATELLDTHNLEKDQEPADEVFEMLDRKKKETLAYKRSFFVRMVSDPKIYNPKIAKTLSRSRHRHVTDTGATVDNGVSIQTPMFRHLDTMVRLKAGREGTQSPSMSPERESKSPKRSPIMSRKTSPSKDQ
ncbi:Tyrosine decarboxylase [Cryptotermes secundus]|uniref:Tyrosine decarboxylase n=1 Tax=Cryptotermes secundus TaxID=105785 RepID=A0A2J7QH66_9NEOP|nr:Tyrosine decarboxylase [Cryptotermes secundus]